MDLPPTPDSTNFHQLSLQGTIMSVDGPKITMKPNHKELVDPLEFQANELRKYFNQGRDSRMSFGRLKLEISP